jgi:phosphatidylethanolamine/phosphatidyl-N-methylethanolamine N-methyltransferase
MRRLTLPKGSWTFFRQWLRNPARTAAVTPSGRDLAAAMVAALPEGARRVIELGGGTGAITRALLARGILGRELMVLELNEELHAHLRTRFPQVRIVLGDARDLVQLATADGWLADGPADAIVSGLGFLSMPRGTQREILQASFDCLRDGGRFLQFTYGPQSPVAAEVVEELGLEVERGEFVLLNVPPATVYVFSRRA